MTTHRLNAHTNSFVKLKTQTQDTFEFSVLVCNAVPTLKRNIRLYEKGIVTELVKPDHYGWVKDLKEEEHLRRKDQLKEMSVNYRSKLSKYILISNFSFFEAYVIDVLEEMISFHGGRDNFVKMSQKRAEKQISEDSYEVEEIRRKIRRQSNPAHRLRYKSATQALADKNYRFPSDLLSGYGAKMLLQKIANVSAKDIPSLLTDGLHMAMGEDLVLEFHNAREVRNKIAHGEEVNLTIEQVTNISKALKKIAIDIDQHLLRYYFISEEFLT